MSNQRKKFVMNLLAAASALLCAALLIEFVIHSNRARTALDHTKQSPIQQESDSVIDEAENLLGRDSLIEAKKSLNQQISEHQLRLANLDNDSEVQVPWFMVRKVIAPGAFVHHSDGILYQSVVDTFSISQKERAKIESESRRLLNLIREDEGKRVKLVSDESNGTYFEIPPAPEFSESVHETMSATINETLGSERGALLVDMLGSDQFFPAPKIGREIAIEKRRGKVYLTVRYVRPDGSSTASGSQIHPHSLSQLERRYGHILDFAAWREHLGMSEVVPENGILEIVRFRRSEVGEPPKTEQ